MMLMNALFPPRVAQQMRSRRSVPERPQRAVPHTQPPCVRKRADSRMDHQNDRCDTQILVRRRCESKTLPAAQQRATRGRRSLIDPEKYRQWHSACKGSSRRAQPV